MDHIKATQEGAHPKIIYLEDPELFSAIQEGKKTVEVRVAYSSFTSIKPGKDLEFRFAEAKPVKAKVTAVRTYKSLEELQEKEDMSKIVPNKGASQIDRLRKVYFSERDMGTYGIMAIEFEVVV